MAERPESRSARSMRTSEDTGTARPMARSRRSAAGRSDAVLPTQSARLRGRGARLVRQVRAGLLRHITRALLPRARAGLQGGCTSRPSSRKSAARRRCPQCTGIPDQSKMASTCPALLGGQVWSGAAPRRDLGSPHRVATSAMMVSPPPKCRGKQCHRTQRRPTFWAPSRASQHRFVSAR